MRLDGIGPRTWLLLATVGWLGLAWLLALGGMGAHVARLDGTPEPLPPLADAPAGRLGPMTEYDAIVGRPLFSTDRKLRPFFIDRGEEPVKEQEFEFVLTSVLITPQTRLAILRRQDDGQSVRVKLDESPGQSAWRLVELSERGAVFEGPQGRRSLELQVFDGNGGAPTSGALAAGRAVEPRQEMPTAPVSRPAPIPMPRAESPSMHRSMADGGETGRPDPREDDPTQAAPETGQAQMESIRQRIEARRAALRKDEM